MAIPVPEFSMVVLVGVTGSGKSTFARKFFKPSEIVSSDACRAMVADDESDQSATPDAFALLNTILDIRLKARRLTVVDATNLRPEDRAGLLAIAKKRNALGVAIVLDPGETVCRDRNRARPDRNFGAHVIRNQGALLRRSLRSLRREGFSHVHVLGSEAEIDAATIERQKLWTDKREETGPFDIIGDVHGCADELEALLGRLGYAVDRGEEDGEVRYRVRHPEGRKAVFLGDLVDRGPRVADTLRLVMDMVGDGQALAVLGNHEVKVQKWLQGGNVQINHGLSRTIAELDAAGPAFKQRVSSFIGSLISHYLLDGGRLAVAHAGIREEMLGRASSTIRSFCLYGESTGETDEYGIPVRHDWALDYRGSTRIVYGHTPVLSPAWLNNTLCIDTGCCFGGSLTALRWPEHELVSEPARGVYQKPAGALPQTKLQAASRPDTLDIADVSGKRIVTTRLMPSITIREGNAAAALEIMTRFAIDPKWLVYLPPTMSPSETSRMEGFLEHPAEAFGYFRSEGVMELICEEKHMGSRAVLVVCRDAETARTRFHVAGDACGAIYTRSGRAFFSDRTTTDAALERTVKAAAGLFEELGSDWLVLDAEIMPWSAKAQALIVEQYGAVGAAGRVGLGAAMEALRAGEARGLPLGDLAGRTARRALRIEAFAKAVRGYCWPVEGLGGVRIAPFHLLASEGAVHVDKPHSWHMERLAGLASRDGLFQATATLSVDLADPEQESRAIEWWRELTAAGGEGMVVKPAAFVAQGRRGLIQPAVKCRGPEYLRIIYGPDYDAPGNLDRLRARGLAPKRALALREFALGVEALERFVAGEPLRRVHECVFATLALESEPVDPRL